MDHRTLLHLVSMAALTRAGNPNIGHCYHGYFCAGAGGMSGKLGDKAVHEIGGMKQEVALRIHGANKAAFIKANGAEAYKARAGRLHDAANAAAGKMTKADVQGLGVERDRLIQLLAGGKGSRAEQQQWRTEAGMIQRHLNRALAAQQRIVAAAEKTKTPSATTATTTKSHAAGKHGEQGTAHTAGGHGGLPQGLHAAQSFLHFLEKIIAEFSAGMHEASHVKMGGGGGGGGGR